MLEYLPLFPLQAKPWLTDVVHLQNIRHVLALDVPDLIKSWWKRQLLKIDDPVSLLQWLSKGHATILAKAKDTTTTTMTGGSSVKDYLEGKMIPNPNK